MLFSPSTALDARQARLQRSAHTERKGKIPRELLSGQEHAHWLELLG
jgi:hypothetical protein